MIAAQELVRNNFLKRSGASRPVPQCEHQKPEGLRPTATPKWGSSFVQDILTGPQSIFHTKQVV
jgi:hypothetical protein